MNKETRDLFKWVTSQGWANDLRREVEIRGIQLSEARRNDIEVTFKARLMALLMTKIANSSEEERHELNVRFQQIGDNPFIDWLELGVVLSEDFIHEHGI